MSPSSQAATVRETTARPYAALDQTSLFGDRSAFDRSTLSGFLDESYTGPGLVGELVAPRVTIEPRIYSETGRLRSVVLGYGTNYGQQDQPEITNQILARNRSDGVLHTPEQLDQQIGAFHDALESRGVTVHLVKLLGPESGVNYQIYTRDIGFVIGDTFFLSSMKHEARANEQQGLEEILRFFPEDKIVQAPPGVIIEGGDVIVEDGRVYVGCGGQRTNAAGIDFLRRHIPLPFELTPIVLKPLEDQEDVLHLDCGYTPINSGLAIIYPDGFRDNYRDLFGSEREYLIVSKVEQMELRSNIVSVAPNVVISRPTSVRINAELRMRGVEVIEVPFEGPPLMGGSFRCCSLPLERD